MKKDQNSARLGLHIKLLKRHLSRWKALLTHQKQVRCLTQEDENRQSSEQADKKMAMLERITKWGNRLSQLMERQAEERHQLTTRHQQEDPNQNRLLTSINKFKLRYYPLVECIDLGNRE